MRSWLVVLERRGAFIWPLRGLVHLSIMVATCGVFVQSAEVPLLGWMFGIGAALIMATVTAHAHGLGLMVLYALQESAQEALEGVRREVRELEAAQTSDKRGVLTMEDEP